MNGKNMIHFLLHTPKGRLVLALVIMTVSWGFLLSQYQGSFRSLLPSGSEISRVKNEIEKEKKEFHVLDKKARASAAIRDTYKKRLEDFWDEAADGDVSLGFRELIESAANKQGLKLASLGSTKTSRINHDLSFAELDISFSGSLQEIADFLAAVQTLKPVPAWKRADIRQEMMRPDRPRQDENTKDQSKKLQTVKTTNVATTTGETEQKLRFSGTLRIIYRNAPDNNGEKPAK